MMPKGIPKNNGFTLMELMVAMFVTAVLFTTLFVSYRALFSRTRHMDESILKMETAQALLNRFSLDMASVFIPIPPYYEKPDSEFFIGEDTRDRFSFKGEVETINGKRFPKLTFSAFAHIPDYRALLINGVNEENVTGGNPARITYYVEAEQRDGASDDPKTYVIKRGDTPDLISQSKDGIQRNNAPDPILARGIMDMNVTYMDAGGQRLDEWDSESSTHKYAAPAAVFLSFTLGDEGAQYETAFSPDVYREKLE